MNGAIIIINHLDLYISELVNEVTTLNEKLSACDTQKHADKECLKTMQLMIDSLTENKLSATNKINDLEKTMKNLSQQLTTANDKLTTLSELQIENEAQTKQIKRLTAENEEQENDLRTLDEKFAKVSEISKRQTQELLILEQSVDRWKQMEIDYEKLQEEQKSLQTKFDALQTTNEASNDYKAMIKSLEQERDESRQLCDEMETQFEEMKKELDDLKSSSQQFIETNNDKIDVFKEQLQHENELLKKKCDEQTFKLSKYKTKIIEFSCKLKEMKQSKKILSETVGEYSSSVTKWQKQITNASELLIKEVAMLNATKIDLENQLKTNNESIENMKNIIDEMKDSSANSAIDVKDIEEKYQMLLIDYKSLENEIQSKNTEIENITADWEKMCTALKIENEKYGDDIKNMTSELQDNKKSIEQLEEKCELSNTKNDELLSEMRELNDVLKTRGNVISNQTTELNQVKCDLQEQSKQINQLEEQLKEKNKQIDQLRQQFDSQSEILSTSTISRVDDIARMKDIEDSFEEKYNKLRILAVKLKKKIAEQQAVITKSEPTTSKSISSTPESTSNIQNLKSLQTDNDRLLDKIDNMTIERKKLLADIAESNQQKKNYEDELKSLRIVNEDVKATADANQKIKSALDEQIKIMEKQIDELKVEHRDTAQVLKSVENENVQLKGIKSIKFLWNM